MPIVNVGTSANDGTGSGIRSAFQAINTELARLAELIEEAGIGGSGVPLVKDTIAEMKAVDAPSDTVSYALVFVLDDGSEQIGMFEFDATVTADNEVNGEYVITAGGGGFRRKGL